MSPNTQRLLVVSNRLPIVLEKRQDGWGLKPGSGGLVSALAPVLSHRGGVWVGWPGMALDPAGDWQAVLASGYQESGYELVPVSDPQGTYAVPDTCWAEADTGEAAAWLARLYADTEMRRTMASRARQAATEKFSLSAYRAAIGDSLPDPRRG